MTSTLAVASKEAQIPKKIHYIWLGKGAMSKTMQTCMTTWSIVCPDYQIIRWDENNYDIEKSHIIKLAIQQKNWALAADVMRADILYNHGGIYLDTDIELLQSLDSLLNCDFFIGYEKKHWVNNAVIGAVPNCDIFKKILAVYNFDQSITKNSNLMAVYTYSAILKWVYGIVPDGKTTLIDSKILLLSQDFFYPKDWLTSKSIVTPNTIAIHHYAKTWNSSWHKMLTKMLRAIRFVFGAKVTDFFETMYVKKTFKRIQKKINSIQDLS